MRLDAALIERLEAAAAQDEAAARADLARAMVDRRTARIVRKHRLRPLVEDALACRIEAGPVLDAISALGECRMARKAAR